jgi:hypothetical protein
MEYVVMKRIILALISITTACASASPDPRTSASSVASQAADLAAYQTFAFGPANQPATGSFVTARSLEVERRLAPLVQSSLEKRGYSASSGNADLVIKISAGSGTLDENKVDRGNTPASTPGGFIGIDAYDRATGADVWHGTAFAAIDPARIDDQLLAQGVEHMFADFPHRHQ